MHRPLKPPTLQAVADAPVDEVPDDELMLAARGGDRAAFDRIVRRHQQRVLGYAFKFFQHTALAYDVAQDVFVDVLRALPRYRAEGRFVAYLSRVTVNRCRMAARDRRLEDRFGGPESLADEPAAVAPDREQARLVNASLRRLTDKQREVVLLRFWLGLSLEEIAEAAAVPVGTVKSRLFGALGALREEIAR